MASRPKKQILSDYEQLRKRNIEANQIVLAKLLDDFKDLNPDHTLLSKERQKRKYTRRTIDIAPRRNPSRLSRYSMPSSVGHVKRSGSVASSVASSDSNVSSPGSQQAGKLTVKFGRFFKSSQLRDDEISDVYGDDDDDLEDLPPSLPSRMHRAHHTDAHLKDPDAVTQAHLDLVAQHVSEKHYDSADGTTCHQCRQKTDDQKTVCHSEQCFGVRGQFCGPCLRNRYGENAREALKNVAWICPPCRGVCNCSFCRRKAGKASTGILIHLARQHGYGSVYEYLQSFKALD